ALGQRPRFRAPLPHPVPVPTVHRRRVAPRRRGGRQTRGSDARRAPRHARGRDVEPGRRRGREGPGRGAAAPPVDVTTFTGPGPEDDPDAAGPLTLGAFLRDAARRFGAREAVVFHAPEGRVSWSYEELDRHARSVGRALIASGLAPGE